MKIDFKTNFAIGNFDTLQDKLIAVPHHKHNEVHLCLKGELNIPIATIKLCDSDLAKDMEETYEDSLALCQEIVRRFNEFPQNLKQ